jgi:crotonobetainyl-CoA:carnitine CoA-transferase CaiB-like acyl-CoA transferase
VVEFTHMVMGPTCGMILADLGAEVIKVEPLAGRQHARGVRLLGSGAGFFGRLLRHVQPQQEEPGGGREGRRAAARSCCACWPAPTSSARTSRPARWTAWASARRRCARLNPRLIYVSHKGFLPGPYEHRTALDEVVQMMGGLAYMTGPEGRPLRAGSSVNDIMGGMFGAIGVLAALHQRDKAPAAPAAARRCRARCSRTTCCWWPST